jgi:transposase-like protein
MTAALKRQIEQAVQDVEAADVRPGQRYPKELRERVTELGRRLRQQGRSWSCLADTFGVTQATLKRWIGDTSKVSLLRPVVVADEVTSRAADRPEYTLVGPSGWRVEGLSLGDLAELIHR